jgi:hypothetical protein
MTFGVSSARALAKAAAAASAFLIELTHIGHS